MAQPNGAINGSGTQTPVGRSVSSLPTVVGINFGNTYASIAVLNKVHIWWFITSSAYKSDLFRYRRVKPNALQMKTEIVRLLVPYHFLGKKR